jgi:hypothetical protein
MMNGETVMRDGHQSHVQLGQGLPFSELGAKGASARSRPGILIFSCRRHLLHMNRRALELTGHLHQAVIGPVNETRSVPVRELGAQIQEALFIRKKANIREPVEMKRLIIESGRKILLRGIGLADRNSFEDSRIVILLEEISLREEHKLSKHQRARSFLKTVSVSPWNQPGGDPKSEVVDARAVGVFGTSTCLDQMGGVGISEGELP